MYIYIKYISRKYFTLIVGRSDEVFEREDLQ